MRIKKGFTLAEILIVLMVIGVIATMTIPSLMKGVTEAQYKAAYKKAYNAIVNLVAMEKIAGQLPSKNNSDQAIIFWASMASNLSVKEFIASNIIDGGVVALAGDAVPRLKFTGTGSIVTNVGTQSGTQGTGVKPAAGGTATGDSWLITDDGLAYTVTLGSLTPENDCGNKQEINAAANMQDAHRLSCMVIVVDVNGLYKGPNRLEQQNTVAGQGDVSRSDTVSSSEKMNTLTRDRYYIYVGADGATHGPAATTVSGRIINDMK